jgi:thiol:disulfide interchange protein
MKTILFLLTLLLTISSVFSKSPAPSIKWQSYKQALDKIRKDNSIMFIDVYADWCLPCKIMDKSTYPDSAVVRKITQHFVPVKLDSDSEELIECNNWPRTTNTCATSHWRLAGVPSIALIGPSGNYILSVTQYLSAEDLNLLLDDFIAGKEVLLKMDKEKSVQETESLE